VVIVVIRILVQMTENGKNKCASRCIKLCDK